MRTLHAKTLIREMFSSKKSVKIMMQILQEYSQNVQLSMLQKINEKEKIKIAIKAKFIYHAIKTKEILIAMIFSLISTLKNILI